MEWQGLPGVHQGSEGHQGSPSLGHWAPSWGEVMGWDVALACHCTEPRETQDLLMACGNPSLVGRSFSGAGVKVFLICHLDRWTRLLWCLVSKVKTVTQLNCWHQHTSSKQRSIRAYGAEGNVSVEALCLEKVSGCFGGDIKEALHDRRAGDTSTEFCWEALGAVWA